MSDTCYGFRIVGPVAGARMWTNWNRAFAAYCAAEVPGGVAHEAYLSAFQFPIAFKQHLDLTGSTKGYDGSCGSAWCWWDIDRQDDLDTALKDARRLCLYLGDQFIQADALLVFFSGSKGFHVGLPLAGFNPEPGPQFHLVARRFAEDVAGKADIKIDTGIYDKVRAFRAPNSRHPKTGKYKRTFSVDELLHLGFQQIVSVAANPAPFDPSELSNIPCCLDLPAAWKRIAAQVQQEAAQAADRCVAVTQGIVQPTLNRQTLDFIRHGASVGDRHRLLFSAAANLAELGAPMVLCRQLLTESALDSGLPPSEVERQIRCGLEHVQSQSRGGAA